MRRLVGLSLFFFGALAQAATLHVNSLGDDTTSADGLVTLREAILASVNRTTTDLGETGTGTDTIAFTGAATSGTLNLSGVLPNLSGNVTISGPGSSALTIDGGGNVNGFGLGFGHGIFFVDSGTITIQGLTLTGGCSRGGFGGSAPLGPGGGGAGGMGGALFVNSGTVAV
ncbi:MAG TPA: hypothetical protein VJ853_09680, partial [Thermoanaerobaculia bacterium]|nr:hypothetical protein [Thermoanaerobaculia bacterium]